MLEKGSITSKGLTQYNEAQTNTDQGNRNIWNVNSLWPVPLLCTVINSISMNASKLNIWEWYDTLVMQESFKTYNVNSLCHFLLQSI